LKVDVMFGTRKKAAKVWQKILGLQKGNKIRVTSDFFYHSPRLKKLGSEFATGIISKGTIGEIIEVGNPPSKDMRIYRIRFPNQLVWCSDLKLELIVS